MEPLLGLVGLAILAIPPAVIYLLISNASLLKRVRTLEAQLSSSTPSTAKPTSQTAASPAKPLVQSTPQKRPEIRPAAPGPQSVPAPDTGNALAEWLSKNWFYAVSAVSLALAGIFLVQYGIEKGLLPPVVRVLAAAGFGCLLILGGEVIRRRFGDDAQSSTEYLPSVFSGAGIVTLFGAVLAARGLYGLIGPEIALGGMALVGVGAMVLGWFYGPLLAAVGILGAMAAPFVVGGSSDNPSWLFAYFAIVAIAGLAIDTIQRWAWVSILSLVLGFVTGTVLLVSAPTLTHQPYMLFCFALALAGTLIPQRRLLPDHEGPAVLLRSWSQKVAEDLPFFPTRLAAGALLAAVMLIPTSGLFAWSVSGFWLSWVLLSAFALFLLIATRKAPAIADLAVLPLLGLIGTLPLGRGAMGLTAAPDGPVPVTVSLLMGVGLVLSCVAAWRSLRGGREKTFMAAIAALCAPVLAVAIAVIWWPGEIVSGLSWALRALVIAIFMMGFAERFHKADGAQDRTRASMAAVSGLTAIAFALVALFSTAALTLALAVTLVLAATLDRRFNLPLMTGYICVGVPVIMSRLVIEPGLDWARSAPLLELFLSHGGAVIGFGAAYVQLRSTERNTSKVMLESAFMAAAGLLITTLLYRSIVGWGGSRALESHWSFGLNACVWLLLCGAQIYRLQLGGALKPLRSGLGFLFLLLGAANLLAGVILANPLISRVGGMVIGVPLINSLLPAYLLPASLFYVAHQRGLLKALPAALQKIPLPLALGLAGLWGFCVIRHFWQGAMFMRLAGFEDGELYTYTLVMVMLGAGLITQSIRKQNPTLRKAGLIVVGLTVAKVFLIDISGLGGLVRVFSLLLLGLSLAGLAWLNRWADQQSGAQDAASDS
ncbi:MAG: DUF2339 domain-containing protein [Pseudomonadota bacterium]